MRSTSNSSGGFTLLELLISAVIGLILVLGSAQLYSLSLQASFVTSQKAELQQDFRAAANLLQRDISLAGAGALGQQGLANGQVGLPTGTGINPVYPCNGLTTCSYIAGAPVAYPQASTVPYLYSIIPGYDLGIVIDGQTTDIITVVSTDVSLALNCYTASINTPATIVTFQLPSPLPSTCVLPSTLTVPQALNAAVVGLQAGDLVMFGTTAVGVVTSAVTTCAPTGTNTACFTVDFAATDPGHINQPGATTGSLSQFVPTGTASTASTAIPGSPARIQAITYYLDICTCDGVTPRLMRIQNGRPPAPVAENVIYLKFTYDVNDNSVVDTNQPSLPTGTSPNMITKVNIAHMTMRSQEMTTGGYKGNSGYQGLDLQTSITARNLTSNQEYPISGSSY